MRGDYSRKRFDPAKHYGSVLQQQGRVALDAEWNEQAAIQDRRWRAETADVIGRCGVPEDMPTSFEITPAGNGLAIGPGRIYVDGLLAENHGAAPFELVRALEELYGTAPVALDAQPYRSGAQDALGDGRNLVYVDVWRREVSRRQIEGLVEPALGVDTTTREQIVWQVRVLPELADVTDCSTPLDDIEGWPARHAVSEARLTTATVEVDAAEDPCVIPPSGGYRGLENQLYRVEVHDQPAPDQVRVKWSRENGAVSARVLEVLPGSESVRVDEIGKDDVLRFRNGDWVEFTDNTRELRGLAGEMRRVTVSDERRTLEFAGALPADLLADPDGAHLRVVRWDQTDDVDADGLIVLGGGDSVVLEAGIEITLDLPATGRASTGDYWCFAARAVGASVEKLDRAAPLGIHHHFCKLAIVEVANGSVSGITDCRPKFPPLTRVGAGCCTFVVRPGESIQAALDALPPEGGCVCLKTGEHVIEQPLRIRGSHVSLHGESRGAVVRRDNGLVLLEIASDEFAELRGVDVSMLHFDMRTADDTFEGIVQLRRVSACRIADCRLTGPAGSLHTGVILSRCDAVTVSDCEISEAFMGILAIADSTNLRIVRNRIEREVRQDENGLAGIWLRDAFASSRIEHNDVGGYFTGVSLNVHAPASSEVPRSAASGSRIHGNSVRLFGVVDFDSFDKTFGIDVAATDCEISNNTVSYPANWHGGIRVSASRVSIVGNRMSTGAADDDAKVNLPVGVQYGIADDAAPILNDGLIADNRILGDQTGIVVLGAEGHRIEGNLLRGSGAAVRMPIVISDGSLVCVERNRVSNGLFGVMLSTNGGASTGNVLADNEIVDCNYGVWASAQTSLTMTGNSVVGSEGFGIFATGIADGLVMAGNTIRSCGYRLPKTFAVGVFQHDGELRFIANRIVNAGVSRDGEMRSALAVGLRAEGVRECLIQGNHIGYDADAVPDALNEHRAMLLQGLIEQTSVFSAMTITLGYCATIVDNKFSGPGNSALIEILEQRLTDNLARRFERVIFSNNHCDHVLARITGSEAATVQMRGRLAICQGNHFKSNLAVPSVNFNRVRSTYLGNVAMAAPTNFTGKPSALDDFNLQ